jgi:hypothetical protein
LEPNEFPTSPERIGPNPRPKPILGFGHPAHRAEGDSAGGHLAALVGLAPDQFTAECRGDANYAASAEIKVVIGF